MTDTVPRETIADASDLPPDVLMRVNHLVKNFPITRGIFFKREVGSVQAVSDISFEIKRGETLGLVGESGCGKSTTARCVIRLLDATSGQVYFQGEGTGEGPAEIIDIATADKNVLRQMRREVQIVFQDPYASGSARSTPTGTPTSSQAVSGNASGSRGHLRSTPASLCWTSQCRRSMSRSRLKC